MSDNTNPNRIKWNLKRYGKLLRFLKNELKTRPAFIKPIIDKISVRDDKLYYSEKEIIPREEAMNIIRQYDLNPMYSGGINKLEFHINQKYVGITRSMIVDYIRNSESHQLHQPRAKTIRQRAIITTDLGKVSQIDLIDMQSYAGLNNNDRYILTYVDLFSKYGSARAIKNKEVKSVIIAIDDILSKLPPGTLPKVIQSDNGSEFDKQFENHLSRKWKIKTIHSSAYSPQTQGAIERFNRTIKSKIFLHMTKFNTAKWNDVLDLIIQGYNNTKHSTTNRSPNEVISDPTNKDIKAEVLENIKLKAARNQVVDDKELDLNVGDHVRISKGTTTDVKKNKFGKGINQNWSRRIYTIIR